MVTVGLFIFILFLPSKLRINIFIFIIIFSFNVSSVLPTQFWLNGNITLEHLVYIFFVIYSFQKGYFKNAHLTVFGKIGIMLAIIILVIEPTYVAIKDSFFVDSKPLSDQLISISKSALKILIMYFLIIYVYKNPAKKDLILRMILYAAGIYCITSVFYPFLAEMGYNVREIDESVDITRVEGITRISQNPFGVMIVIVMGILFNFYLLKKIKTIEFLALASFYIIGILLTGSRTAFIALVFIMVLFLMDKRLNLRKNTSFGFMLFLVVTLYLYSEFGATVIERIKYGEETYSYGGLEVRMGYWEMYLNDIKENLHYLYMGNTEPATYYRSPHNFYVLLMFKSGLFFISLIMVMVFRLYKNYWKFKKRIRVFNYTQLDYIKLGFILVPQLLYWITGTYPFFYWSIFFLGVLYVPMPEIKSDFNSNITKKPFTING